jgi:hypothetical protein
MNFFLEKVEGAVIGAESMPPIFLIGCEDGRLKVTVRLARLTSCPHFGEAASIVLALFPPGVNDRDYSLPWPIALS